MSGPPLGTLWIDSLPSTSPDYVIGIDTAFFNVNSIFKGLKHIPPGIHIFHYAEAEDMRAGWWFEIKDHQVLGISWDCESEQFRPKHVDIDQVGAEYHLLVSYPEKIEVWRELTKHVEVSFLEAIAPAFPEPITTATPSKEENIVLRETLKKKDPEQTFEDSRSELDFTIVSFRSAGPRENADVGQITKNALDRSWQVEELFPIPQKLLAELQVSFINFCVLANLCSCTQWTTLLRLVSSSETYLRKYSNFAIAFLEAFSAQLEKVPEEYMSSSDIGVIDTSELVNVLEKLGSMFAGSGRWRKIEQVCRSRFGFHLKNLEASFDKDNYEVYNIEDHDADDEEAPAVV